MSNYIGVRCPVCNKKFTEADDIVVCPVCGAPHHRDCYNQAGQCAFAADHLSGKEWHDPAGEVPLPHGPGTVAQQSKTCERCGASNQPEQIFCQVCGYPLATQRPQPGQQPNQQAPYGPGGYPGGQQPWGGYQGYGYQPQIDTISMAYGGLSPDDSIEGESVKDLAQYIGGGSAYYLPRFKLLAEHARAISINLSALVFGFLYYFYRKMYLLGAILLMLYVVSSIPSYLYTWEILPQMLFQFGLGPAPDLNMAQIEHLIRLSNITRLINFLIVAVMSVMANRFYFNRVITAVHDIRTAAGEDAPSQQYGPKLAMAGGNNKGAVIAAIATIMTGAIVASSVMLGVYERTHDASSAAADAANTQSAVVNILPEETVNEEST